MDYNVLKAGFIEYLERKNTNFQENGEVDKDVSIFSHSSEFKEYLRSEFDFNSAASLNEILDMELVDGKLVDVNEMSDSQLAKYEKELEQKSAKIDTQQGTSQSANITNEPLVVEQVDKSAPIDSNGNRETKLSVTGEGLQNWANKGNIQVEDADFMADILNDLLEYEDFKQAIIGDDKEGKVTSENLGNFLKVVQEYDGEKENLSLQDLISAVQDIQDGVFRNLTDEQIKNTVTENGKINTPYSNAAGLNKPASKVTAANMSTPNIRPTKDSNGSAILSNMTKDELEKEKKDRQNKVGESKTNLSSIADGSDSTIKGLQENVDNSYQEFQETLEKTDEQLAKQLDAKKQEIDSVEQEIASKDAEIASAEATLSQAQNNQSNAQSTVENLQSNLTALQSAASSAQGDQRTAIQQSVAQAQSKLQEAQQAKQEADQAVQEAQENLDRLKEEKAALEEKLNSLQNDPEGGMQALEQQVSQLCETNPQLQALKQNYDNSKEKLQETKTQMMDQAKEELNKSQQELNEVNTALAKVQNQDDSKELSPNGDVLKYASQFLGLSEKEVEAKLGNGVDLPDGLWCSAFTKQMLSGTYGSSLPDWYTKANTNSCSEVFAAANNNGKAFTDASQAKSGDLIFFNTKRGNCRHVGFVEKIENGVVYTLEGNSSGEVKQRQYKIGEGNRIFGFARVP